MMGRNIVPAYSIRHYLVNFVVSVALVTACEWYNK